MKFLQEWEEQDAKNYSVAGIVIQWKDQESVNRLISLSTPLQPKGNLAIYNTLLQEEIKEGIVDEVPDSEVKLHNQTFCVPKHSGDQRKVLDARLINNEILKKHFKMHSVQTVSEAISKDYWLASLDIKSAYSHIKVHPSLKPFLGFAVRDKSFLYRAMPFGLRLAPLVFTKTLAISIKQIRKSIKSTILHYADDILLLNKNKMILSQDIQTAVNILQAMGWIINFRESELTPQQSIKYLDLQWWLSKVTSNKGRSIIPPAPIQCTITTDASHLGWGSTLEYNNRTWIAWGNWPNPKLLKSSNQREMKAIHYALMHFAPICNKEEIHSIMIRSDNQVAVQDNKRRRAAPILAPTLRQILKLEEDKKWSIEAVYLKGELNSIADRLSRLEKAGDYQLKKDVLNEALQKLQVSPTLDAFATRRNSLFPRFLSPTDDNRAIGTNGLKFPWGQKIVYAHPPIAIIGRCLQKIQSEKTTVVLILPDWQQWWSSVVKEMEIKSIQLGQADQILKPGKSMKRNECKLPPGSLVAHLIQIGEEMKYIN
ncbi:MAG: putative Polyprotein P3 [Streblomastix strix]|uniref:Putative Polyprotein P3 n=1 Tax=Streblomastix strix TaxID=222440 RepID=A0A5J4WDS5_9EUKA|nr:MAG: putative Polyprotein P3 [Streblomastix strix]